MSQVQYASGKMIPASKFGKDDASTQKLELTCEEIKMGETLKVGLINGIGVNLGEKGELIVLTSDLTHLVHYLRGLSKNCYGFMRRETQADCLMNGTEIEDISRKNNMSSAPFYQRMLIFAPYTDSLASS